MKKLITIIICSQLFLSCRQITKSVDDTFKTNDSVANKAATTSESHTTTGTEQHEAGKGLHFLTDINKLEKAETELKRLPQYTGKKIFIYSGIHFYSDGRINLTLQHPENPKYVDGYNYNNGAWSKPEPVQLSVKDDVPARLVSLDQVSFINVATVSSVYNEKVAQVEGAKLVSYIYLSISDKTIHWFPTTIEGSRERYSIEFNANGTLKSYHQD